MPESVQYRLSLLHVQWDPYGEGGQSQTTLVTVSVEGEPWLQVRLSDNSTELSRMTGPLKMMKAMPHQRVKLDDNNERFGRQ